MNTIIKDFSKWPKFPWILSNSNAMGLFIKTEKNHWMIFYFHYFIFRWIVIYDLWVVYFLQCHVGKLYFQLPDLSKVCTYQSVSMFGTWLFNMSMPLPYTQENSTIMIRLWFWQWRQVKIDCAQPIAQMVAQLTEYKVRVRIPLWSIITGSIQSCWNFQRLVQTFNEWDGLLNILWSSSSILWMSSTS